MYIIRLATNMELIVIIIVSQRGNDLLYSLSVSPNFSIKLTMGTSIIGGNSLRMKLNCIFVMLFRSKSDINLKLNNGLDKFINGPNVFPLSVMGTMDEKDFTM